MASGNIIEYIMNLNTKKGTESLKKLAKSTQDALKKLVNIGLKSKISFAQMSKAAKQAGKSISSIKKLMTGLIASIGGAATAIIGFSQKVANSVNEIVDASTRSGIAIDTLAGLRLALEGSGRSFSEVERGLDKFQKRMVTAASGTGEASKHFKAQLPQGLPESPAQSPAGEVPAPTDLMPEMPQTPETPESPLPI